MCCSDLPFFALCVTAPSLGTKLLEKLNIVDAIPMFFPYPRSIFQISESLTRPHAFPHGNKNVDKESLPGIQFRQTGKSCYVPGELPSIGWPRAPGLSA